MSRAPATVLVSTYLMGGVAALRVTAAVSDFYAVPEMGWIFSERYGDEDRGQTLGLTVGLFGAGSLLAAVPFVLLAIFTARAHNWARVLTWIAGPLAVLSLLLIAGFTIYDELPWYTTFANVNATVSAVLLVVALVLLALPPSHRYYRRVQPPPPPAYNWAPLPPAGRAGQLPAPPPGQWPTPPPAPPARWPNE